MLRVRPRRLNRYVRHAHYARVVFERFTESARQVVVLAQEEARALRQGYIGTEHLLLGLIREEGRAATTLGAHGVQLEPAREWFAEHVGRGDEGPPAGQLPLTPRLKKIFLMADEDAEGLGHRAIGTQHLLIALRAGLLHDTYPDAVLDDDRFDESWQWLGSYATWSMRWPYRSCV